jgi:hypothetical protein
VDKAAGMADFRIEARDEENSTCNPVLILHMRGTEILAILFFDI